MALLERHRGRPLVDIMIGIVERDRRAAGTVVGSAVAFRLFLFFVPMVLFVVGLAGFFTHAVTTSDLGITGSMARQIETALQQPHSTRWLAAAAGLVGVATTGRTLSKALTQAGCLAWRLPVRAKASVRVIGAVIGLIVGMGVISTVVNRIRANLGLGVTGLSLVAALMLYL